MKPAPTQATIDSASRTKPRANANTADSPITAMTPISSGFTAPPALNGKASGHRPDPPRGLAAARRGEPLDQFAQMTDRYRGDAAGGARGILLAAGAWPRRDPGLGKAELRRLLEPRVAVRHRAHPARESDLAEHHRLGRHRAVAQRRDEGRGNRQIARRLADAQAPRDVEVDVVGA